MTRLGPLVALLAAGCLEGFGALETTVRYDAFRQVFEVERRLLDVDAHFFGCDALEGCADRVARALALEPVGSPSTPAEVLLKRLLDSGAQDIAASLVTQGDRVDVLVRYDAPLATPAAEDTMVRAEFHARRRGAGGRYYLVVDAGASAEPPDGRWTLRKSSQAGSSGIDWREQWVMPPRRSEVRLRVEVSPVEQSLLADHGIRDALVEAGLVVAELPAATVPPPSAEVESLPVATVRPGRPSRKAPPAAPPVFLHAPRVRGAMDDSVLAASLAALQPALEACVLARRADRPDLFGFLFLFARVDAGGTMASRSVYGTVADPALFACAEDAFREWAPPPGEAYEVELPVTVREALESRRDAATRAE